MDKDKEVTANFIKTYELTIAISPTGGGKTTPAAGNYTYDEGTKVTISASANEGYRFVSWAVGVADSDSARTAVTATDLSSTSETMNNSITVIMDKDKEVTANFIKTYNLTMAAVSPAGGGTTSPASPGKYTYDAGKTVNISASAASGYKFVNWTGDVAAPGSTSVTMSENRTVKADFAKIQYTVTFDSQGGSAVAPQTVEHGGLVTKPTDPTKTGYTFGAWYKESGCTNAWVFASDTVTSDVTLYAKWTAAVYIPCITDDGNDCYGVSSYSYYDAVNNKTTLTYTVWEKWIDDNKGPTCKDISNFKLNFGDTSWVVSMNVDEGTGGYTREVENGLIKMDVQDGFKKGTITITFTGRVEAVTGSLTIKAGQNEPDFNVCKPDI